MGEASATQLGRAKPLRTILPSRLDDMHRGFNEYFGNKLSFAPIKNPKKILEVGYGNIHLVHVASRLIFSPKVRQRCMVEIFLQCILELEANSHRSVGRSRQLRLTPRQKY